MLELGAVVLTLGAVFYHSLAASFYTIVLIALSGAIFCSILYRTKQGIVWSFLLGLAFVLGALTVSIHERDVSEDVYGARAFDATVISVDERLNRVLIVVRENDVRYQASLPDSNGMLPGDMVLVRGIVVAPESFLTDNGRLFDYPRYLESKRIHAIIENASFELEEHGTWSPTRFATSLRHSIAQIFSASMRFPTDGIVAGMLVGYQGGLPKGIQDLFRDTGVLHVLVLSGYNITLLAGALALLLRPLPFRTRTVITVACIILLVLISGSGIASIRAGIMGSIALFAGLVRRTYQPMRALTLAYLLFFFISPTTIFSDPGFHLSFLATLFMILALPKVESLFRFLPDTNGISIRELLMLAVSVPIFMLPYIMYFSGNFPLVSPVANILLALATPILMLLGALVLVLSVLQPLAHIVGSLSAFIGGGVIKLLEVMDRLPQWNTPQLSWWGVTLFYAVLLYLLFRKDIKQYARQLQSDLLRTSSSAE